MRWFQKYSQGIVTVVTVVTGVGFLFVASALAVGFLYTVVRSSLRLIKQSRKGSFPFSSISLVN